MKKWISVVAGAAIFTLAISSCGDSSQTNTTETASSDSSTAVAPSPRLGAQMWTFHTVTFMDALAKVDSAGLRFIEAFQGQSMGGDFNDTFGLNMRSESKTKIKTILAQKGITLVAMGVVVPATIDEWKQNFELAKEMGLEYITAEPKREHLDSVNSMAGRYGIRIAIHDHPNPSAYASPDSVITAMQGRPNIGACADIGHWARNGLDVVDCLKKLEGHVYGVHLKDIQKFNDVHAEDTTLGHGVLRLPEILAELKRQKFSGIYSIEHELHWENNVPDVIMNREYFEKQVAALK